MHYKLLIDSNLKLYLWRCIQKYYHTNLEACSLIGSCRESNPEPSVKQPGAQISLGRSSHTIKPHTVSPRIDPKLFYELWCITKIWWRFFMTHLVRDPFLYLSLYLYKYLVHRRGFKHIICKKWLNKRCEVKLVSTVTIPSDSGLLY